MNDRYPAYSVLSNKWAGCNKRAGRSDFFLLLHEKKTARGGGQKKLVHEKLRGVGKTSISEAPRLFDSWGYLNILDSNSKA